MDYCLYSIGSSSVVTLTSLVHFKLFTLGFFLKVGKEQQNSLPPVLGRREKNVKQYSIHPGFPAPPLELCSPSAPHIPLDGDGQPDEELQGHQKKEK